MKGFKTIDGALRAGVKKDMVAKYGCMECGSLFYGRWHSKWSSPPTCPFCDADDEIFVECLGFAHLPTQF